MSNWEEAWGKNQDTLERISYSGNGSVSPREVEGGRGISLCCLPHDPKPGWTDHGIAEM